MSKTLYVAGPMTGVPHFNFPLFDAVSAALRADGFTIISPAETDHEKTRAAAMESLTGSIADLADVEGTETWGDCLARDVKMLADGVVTDTVDEETPNGAMPRDIMLKIDGIALLPGWEKSRGARLEAFVGLLTGKEYFRVHEVVSSDSLLNTYGLAPVTADWVQHMLALAWAEGIKMHAPIPYAQTIP